MRVAAGAFAMVLLTVVAAQAKPAKKPGGPEVVKLCGTTPSDGDSYAVELDRVVTGELYNVHGSRSVLLDADTAITITRKMQVLLVGVQVSSVSCANVISDSDCLLERKRALESQKFAESWFAQHPRFTAFIVGKSKAGPFLGYICADGMCLNYHLLAEKLAKYGCEGAQ